MGRRSRKSKRRMNSLFLTLVLTAIMLIMSTYAWFSANRQVEINGITAKVRAAEGLQISLDGISWDTAVTIDKAKLVGYGTSVNNVAWADKLEPVSSDGTFSSSDGELNFYFGEVSPDGTILKNVDSTKAVSTTAVGGGEGDTGLTNKYIAFDIYLKNSSSKATDNLQLANGSFIKITKGKEAPGDNGQDDTGLEYSVRTALQLYAETAAFTDSQSKINGLGYGEAKVAIWEPNYNQHIGEIVRLDSRIDDADQAFNTLAMNATSKGKNIQGINGVGTEGAGAGMSVELDADGNVDDTKTKTPGTYMTIPSTIQTGGSISAGGDKQLYTVAGTGDTNKITLPGNAISKARVYIWLEGQDPDCQDTASTGKSFDLQINLSKPNTNS